MKSAGKGSLIVVKFILGGLVILFTISSCKYDEGPCISFRSTDKRMGGHYVVDKFEVDLVDMTIEYRVACDCDVYFPKGDNDLSGFKLLNCKGIKATNMISGNYFRIGNENIEILFSGYSSFYTDSAYGYGPFNYGLRSIWKIHRLTHKETFMEAYYYGKKYRVEMHEIE